MPAAALPVQRFVRWLLQVCLLWIFCPDISGAEGLAKTSPATNDAVLIRTLVTAEETDLVLNQKLKGLSRGLRHLRLPAPGTESVFHPSAVCVDLAPQSGLPHPKATELATGVWPASTTLSSNALPSLWRPLLDQVQWFEHADFKLSKGQHPGGNTLLYESEGTFDGMAWMKSSVWISLHGTFRATWSRTESKPEWQMTTWVTAPLSYVISSNRFFVEKLDTVIHPPEDAAKLRRSLHYEATVRYYKDAMKTPPHPYFAPISANQKEGLAVADVNGDGFDDIYITVRIGKNLLLINRGDGTFVEEGAKYGLDLPGHTTCALFADFDNDGDLDVMLGRSLLRSSYLENRNGKFIQPPIPKFMPMAVISMAAADYNNDGLLDVYLCTYRPAAPAGASPAGGVAQVKDGDFDWPDEFFSPELAREYRRRIAEHRQRRGGTVLDQLGPPNVLLVNRGGGQFEVAPENSVVGLWRNSLQATWGDFDQDGDPDLFIANDWAPSNLLRNDGSAGFKDISVEAGIQYYGFSMGATWGDYDNDGLDDVYVSNMFSASGRRMTQGIPGLDKMFIESATGNYLYHQQKGSRFEQVAGLEAPALLVMNAGWSWGGCFVDFDNDSFLDLYVINGYFTAPRQISSDMDIESNLWRTMVRTDENMSRPSFRFSPEWKRTGAPDNLGPQIDARLSGVEKEGDRVLVHSLNGNERNRYFANRRGREFQDLSAISGLDNPADSRGFAMIDYDRDGWQDLALVNANQPLFNFYRNELGKTGAKGGIIAIRFVGGNKSSAATREFSNRDGFGARVFVELPGQTLTREQRCGDGWSTQNSATMLIGIGANTAATKLSIHWPSGKRTALADIPEGTLLTAYENPADNPKAAAFDLKPYRIPLPSSPAPERPLFAVARADAKPRAGARLRVYTTLVTSSPECQRGVSIQKFLRAEFETQPIDWIVVPVDENDDNNRLAAYNTEYHPPARLVNPPQNMRAEIRSIFGKALGEEAMPPTSVITDGAGRLLECLPGLPTVSDIRRWLAKQGP